MYSVPIQADGQNGIGELRGVLRFDGSRPTLQFQTADPIMHDFRTPPVELPLDPATLVGAQYRAGFLWLRPTLQIRVSDIARVAGLPAAEPGQLRFRVPRSQRADARKIAEDINAACAEVRYQQLNESIARMTSDDPLGLRTERSAGAGRVDPAGSETQ